jgi:hypothetical protein
MEGPVTDQKSIDRKALQKMIRFAQREAGTLRMTFTAYLLNLAAESLDERAQKSGTSGSQKGPHRTTKRSPKPGSSPREELLH